MDKNSTLKILKNVVKEENFSFTNNTTYGCGGLARIAYFPNSIEQAVAIYDYLSCEQIKFVTLGNGSNVLASDNFFDGAVVSTKLLTGIERTDENSIFCLAGTKVSSLLKYCADNGLCGLGYLAGIPASIGGIVYMNGGAGGKFISENVVGVKLYDGKIREFLNKSCKFGHKYSIMRDINCLILGTELKVEQKSRDEAKREIANYLMKRSPLPKGKSCGCVFKNVGGVSAGKIIEQAGLKGLSVGGATVSNAHANFIINCGERSADVRALIEEIKHRVFLQTGVILENEVIYIGDFNDTFS